MLYASKGKNTILAKRLNVKIIIEPHTIERANERGTNEIEIRDVVENGIAFPAKYGRLAKYKIYDFNAIWNNKAYKQKKVEVYYVIENGEVFTVTVLVFYIK